MWKESSTLEQNTKLLNLPLLCDLILPFHLLLFKLSYVSHADLLAELHKHLILHLASKNINTGVR